MYLCKSLILYSYQFCIDKRCVDSRDEYGVDSLCKSGSGSHHARRGKVGYRVKLSLYLYVLFKFRVAFYAWEEFWL